jgi:hypothetical protein
MLNITLKRSDILRGFDAKPGWHPCTIAKFEPKAAAQKPGKTASINYVFTITIDDQSDKEADIYFNSQALGTMVPFISAVLGKKLELEDFNFNPEDYIGKKLDVEFLPDEYPAGTITHKPKNFAPKGYGTSGVPF